MKPLLHILIVVLGIVVTGVAAADQNAAELDGLFARLQQVESPSEAERITRRIWVLWRRTDDEAVASAMEQGAQALADEQYKRAEDLYDEVIARAPDYAEGWNKRATVRYLRGDYSGSAADIRRALTLEPRHFGALSGLGLVYMEIGRQAAALDAFRSALEINPFLDGVRRNIEMIRKRMDEGNT